MRCRRLRGLNIPMARSREVRCRSTSRSGRVACPRIAFANIFFECSLFLSEGARGQATLPDLEAFCAAHELIAAFKLLKIFAHPGLYAAVRSADSLSFRFRVDPLL